MKIFKLLRKEQFQKKSSCSKTLGLVMGLLGNLLIMALGFLVNRCFQMAFQDLPTYILAIDLVGTFVLGIVTELLWKLNRDRVYKETDRIAFLSDITHADDKDYLRIADLVIYDYTLNLMISRSAFTIGMFIYGVIVFMQNIHNLSVMFFLTHLGSVMVWAYCVCLIFSTLIQMVEQFYTIALNERKSNEL